MATGGLTGPRLAELRKDPDTIKKLLGIKGLPATSKALLEKALRGPATKDAAFGVSNGKITFASRIDSQDEAVKISKRGGAFDRAGGGTRTVTNNFWEGKGAFASLRAYEKAKGSMA